jgi:hypothetical protein
MAFELYGFEYHAHLGCRNVSSEEKRWMNVVLWGSDDNVHGKLNSVLLVRSEYCYAAWEVTSRRLIQSSPCRML